MAGGYVKLHRKLLDSELMHNHWLFALWGWCLMKANYRARWGVEPGQFITGRLIGSEELKVSPSRFYRGLKTLEEGGYIKLTPNNQRTTVTICNWATYQSDESGERTTSEQRADNERTTSEQRADTIEEVKKVRSKESKKCVGRFTPPTLTEVAEYCENRGNGISPQRFIDHYTASGWRLKGGNAMKDWRAAVRTWENNGHSNTNTAKGGYLI